jgi:Domain of unknown function (DUF4314)
MPRIRPGDRIVLLSMPHDPDPIPVGTEGTVEEVDDVGPGAFTQVEVRWDDDRTLMHSMPPDEVRVVRPSASRH